MRFVTAKALAESGQPVCRLRWMKGKYVFRLFDSPELIECTPNPTPRHRPYTPSDQDTAASDWVVYVEETPVVGKGDRDPNGVDQHAPGAKLDAGKPRMFLVVGGFADALVHVAKVGTYGANKYTDNGWREVPDGVSRYTDAMLRHLLAETHGDFDDESGLMHAAHAAWNALARLQLMLNERAGK